MIFINIILFLFFIAFGACVGSFLTMASHRLPKGEEIIFKKSHCVKCGVELQTKSLIPIVSYILQKGRCLDCGEKIGARYFLVEVINTLAYGLIYFNFGFSFVSFYLSLLFSLLLMTSVIDIENYEIPLYTQIALILFAIVHIIVNPVNPVLLIVSGVIYFFVIEMARKLLERYKKTEVLGGGDIKLVALCGVFLGLKNLGFFFSIAGIVGVLFALIWKKKFKNNIFPFAPSLLFSLFILLFIFYKY